MNDVVFSPNCIASFKTSTYIFAVLNFSNNQKYKTMGNLLYVIAVILIIGWAIGFIGFHAGGIIHLLLVIALIVVVLRVISGRKVV